MMLAYRIWTWSAIALLAFGSVAVFVVFLVTTFRQLRGGQNLDGKPRSHEYHSARRIPNRRGSKGLRRS